jgi:hypothetical protein
MDGVTYHMENHTAGTTLVRNSWPHSIANATAYEVKKTGPNECQMVPTGFTASNTRRAVEMT